MDEDTRAHFETIAAFARSRLEQMRVVQFDITASRSILEIHGKFRDCDVRLKEIHAPSGSLYSYYILEQGVVVVGFDNYPDVRVIKAKFGNQYKKHLGALVPHRHSREKKSVDLLETNAREFLENLERLVSQ